MENTKTGIAFNGKYESINDDYNKIFPILKNKKIKEIWFNRNLVWKPKYLIEGVNYQCYDWLYPKYYLLSNESAYIDTNFYPSVENLSYSVDFKHSQIFKNTQMGSCPILGSRDTVSSNDKTSALWCLNSNQKKSGYRCDLITTNNTEFVIDIRYNESINITLDRISNNIYLNGEVVYSYNNVENKGIAKEGIKLFSTSNIGDSNYNYSGNIGRVFFKENNIIKRDFYPCQLLTPILPQFASDNKPHPAGECGMIDKLTGIFYGNANSTGSFSVYND